MPPKKAAASASVFDGETFCVSGSFALSQNEMKELLIKNGGHIANTPNKECTYVVSDQIGSAKTVKAVKDGIDIVTEHWVQDSVKAGKKLTDKKYFLSGGGAPAAAAAADDDGDDDDDAPKSKKKAAAKKAPAKKAAGTKRKKDDDDDGDDDDDDDDAAKDPPKKASKKSAASTASSSTPPVVAASSGAAPANIKKVVVKNGAPVDDLCPVHAQAHVYQTPNTIYDCMLNQTQIQANNNKFYVIQLLESDASPKHYWVWTRWGRVGVNGQNALQLCGDLSSAQTAFNKKFYDKTRNNWPAKNFVSHSGLYTLLERDYSADEDKDMPDASADDSKKADIPDSKLDGRVQDLVKLICDLKMMKEQMVEVGYDADRLPLGKLSKDHIKKGYEVLQEISAVLDNPSTTNSHGKLTDLSNRFYSLIPHVVGFRPPPNITNKALLKDKIQLVESLADVSFATNLLRTSSTGADSDRNPIDVHYEKLKCEFTPVEKDSKEFQMIKDYTRNTHGHTHTYWDLEVLEAFDLNREGETDRFTGAGFNKTDNRQLLWHGSRLTNYVGIISQGLRIAPPEAPVTGYMFGKGVYFADMVSKSGGYCFTNRNSDVGCMLLCEVALGGMNELLAADYNANRLPAGKLSTKGLGKHFPDPSQAIKLDDGVVVPLGKELQDQINNSNLLYNEYIVYDVAQIRCKYLVKMKFHHKK